MKLSSYIFLLSVFCQLPGTMALSDENMGKLVGIALAVGIPFLLFILCMGCCSLFSCFFAPVNEEDLRRRRPDSQALYIAKGDDDAAESATEDPEDSKSQDDDDIMSASDLSTSQDIDLDVAEKGVTKR